jgi:hypothetical protein
MSDLKTLKDFEGEYQEQAEYVLINNLRKEAIKWAKELKQDNEPLNAVGFIKEFFNLTEEDLK